MSDPIIYPDPFRLRVKKALTASLAAISASDGYKHDLEGKVFRGRDLFGDSDPLPCVSILEAPVPLDQLFAPIGLPASKGDWEFLLQGFVDDDFENPTDPAHVLMADVKRKLGEEVKRKAPSGAPNPFGMGVAQIVNGRAIGNVVSEIQVGPGVVRPPEVGISNKAYFWLGLTVKIVEDISQPFL